MSQIRHLFRFTAALLLATAAACTTADAPRPNADNPDAADIIPAGRDGPGLARDLPPYERPAPAPAPTGHGWVAKDIGALGTNAGRLTFNLGSLLLRAGGTEIGGAADSCAIAFRRLRGDGEIVARVRSVQAASPRSTAGLMVRADDTDPAAAAVYVGLQADPLMGAEVVHRAARGAAAVALPPDPHPAIRNQYLRIRREGRRFTVSRSADRVAWITMGAFDVDMPEEAVFGLAVSARSPTAATQADFELVRLLGVDPAARREGWELETMGTSGAGPVATIGGTAVSVSGVGQDFTTTNENGVALMAPRSGSLTITARVEALEGPPSGRLALMIREGAPARQSSTARNALISVTAAGVVELRRRDRSTNFDPGTMKDALRPPVWLRLVRIEDPATFKTTVSGWYSADGVAWMRLDTAELAIADPAMVGIMYTSGDPRVYGSARITGLSLTTGGAP